MEIVDIFFSSGRRSSAEREAHLSKPTPPAGYGYDYFDNPAFIGYGGYRYDGRYKGAALKMCKHFALAPGAKILEIGCAKGFILYEFHLLGMKVMGVDASAYAISQAKDEVRDLILLRDTPDLPFEEGAFDFVLAKDVLPHFKEQDAMAMIAEIMRVGRRSFLEIQCADTPESRAKMKKWDVTHMTIEPESWWTARLSELGYKGSYHCHVLF